MAPNGKLISFLIVTLLPVILLFALSPTSARAQFESNAVPDFSEYQQFIESVNHFTPSVGAGSHGSFGTTLGLGLQITPRPRFTDITNNKLRMGHESQNNGTAVSPRIQLIKGLSSPIDLGLSFGSINNSNVQQWAGYLQWTAFQKLHWPAIALRYSLAKLTGVPQAKIISHGAEALVSYGLLRYFNLYLSIRSDYHFTSISNYGETIDTTGNRISNAVGVQITILPPYTLIAWEVQNSREGVRNYAGKVSYLF